MKRYFTKSLFLNLLIAGAIFVSLLFMLQYGLSKYTRQNDVTTVPVLQGMNIEQVNIILASRNLKWQVADSVCTGHIAVGCVVEQNPKANTKVKEGRMISVSMRGHCCSTVNH